MRFFMRSRRSVFLTRPVAPVHFSSRLNILEPLYDACLGRMQAFLDELDRSGEKVSLKKYEDFRKTLAQIGQHPNLRYFILKSIIINNLYGVDIMEEAVEICKLRLFLKLVAQVENAGQIEPLPDIDFNIRAGNTLVGYVSLDEIREAIKRERSGQRKLVFRILKTKWLELKKPQKWPIGLISNSGRCRRNRAWTLSNLLSQNSAFASGLIPSGVNSTTIWLAITASIHKRRRRLMIGIHAISHFTGSLSSSGTWSMGLTWSSVTHPMLSTARFARRIRSSDLIPSRAATSMPCALNGVIGFSPQEDDSGSLFRRRSFLPSAWIVSDGCFGRTPIGCGTPPTTTARASSSMACTMRVSAIVLSRLARNTTNPFIATTRYQKWYKEERRDLFSTIHYLRLPTDCCGDIVPKFRCSEELQVFRQVNSMSTHLGELFAPTPTSHSIFYKITGVGHWFTFALKPPKFWRDGKEGSSTRENSVSCREKALRDTVFCCLNSSLHYWLYQARTNCRDFNPSDIAYLPLPDSVAQGLPEFQDLAKQIMKRLDETSDVGTATYNVGGAVSYQKFKPKTAKPLFDEVDRILAAHYGFRKRNWTSF